ncbi:hypothetical protein OUZ56_011182 [Daphnia magna]|uniref:YDG domain-containing protein n=1 Tax=Daphnia magna TaxID=35525 RepID=A0ABQ9YZG7_9CRUS|nr:hypothetical protein OUZ56_011182 [Daphnia magna]
MAPVNNAGLSEYELQRIKNLEENRRILESIRQEQIYTYGDIKPVKQKKDKRNSGQNAQPKKAAVKTESSDGKRDNSDVENSGVVRRKSSRLCGKKFKMSWRNTDNGGDNSDDEDFDEAKYDDTCSDEAKYDDTCSDDEDFEGPKKKRRSQPKGPRGPKVKIVIPKNRPNFYGAVLGVEVGRVWETRMACCADGIHRPTVAGIHAGPEGAYSISLSGGYEDDVDIGECFTYTGEGGRALKGTESDPKNLRTAPQSKDQTLTRGNLALSLNITTRKPVRVIRGSNLKNEFAPEYGYRYDGLYTVEKYWQCVGKSGFKVYKFALRRCPDQAPPPWVSGVVSYANAASSAEEEGDEMDEDEEQKPTVLKVKLFNK